MQFKNSSHLILIFILIIILPQSLFAMHIMEGFLPVYWSITWFIVIIPFLLIGLMQIRKKVNENSKVKILLGVAGAFMFVLSALKLPSVTGSCSHPTGAGLGAILFGPFVMTVLGSIVLIFQALLLAHGGITTLGANTFSMAVIGPFVAILIYKIFDFFKAPRWLSVFLCAFLGDLATYTMTASQLALAFPSANGGISTSLIKFLSIFSFTQIPLAISEGILTVLIFNFILKHNKEELKILNLLKD
ncbi:MAG: energy-coupling factor ABC transporter permease [Spirochaetia bacterium]|nr:energy-coupling factor ABC transporter permease [Spirochaetia bacterium]